MPRPTNLYYEVRAMRIFEPPTPIASDIARHLQSRQFLGMTIVVCRNPLSMLSALRKQWLRLARNLQKQRASTLNAEEILRFTHTIMHMQHLQFAAAVPSAQHEGHIFFTTPQELAVLPPGCLSLYITAPPRASQLQSWLDELAPDALVIDYEGNLELDQHGLQPKTAIENHMLTYWQELIGYMQSLGVNTTQLQTGVLLHSRTMDEALDTLLSAGNDFLRRAAQFQHLFSLAQPLKSLPLTQLKQIEAVMRLAHRVQSLTPGSFGSYLVRNFDDHHADSFFLRDAAPEEDELLTEGEQEEITYYSMHGVSLRAEYI